MKSRLFLSIFVSLFVGIFLFYPVGSTSPLSSLFSKEVSAALLASKTDIPVISFADLAEKLKPAVVNISTTKIVTTGGGVSPWSQFKNSPFEEFFGRDDFFRRFFGGDMPERKYKQRSLGSGFIISTDGYIFTNYHVVEKADKIVVKLSNGKEYDAQVKGKDKNTDMALLKIEPKESLPVVELGDSSKLRVGDWVIAIGNPFGLSQTVTAGIVSAKGRVIGAGPYDDFIQTDASINPGNSGGPLFDINGEVVGINTAIVAQGQGIGFAIPVNMAKKILPQLKTKGRVVRGWLGVSIQDVTEDIAERLNLKEKEGVIVADVFRGDPADKAGIKTGDVIVEINGSRVHDTHELLKTIAGIPVGEKIKVKVLRNGKEKTFKVTVAERRSEKELASTEQGKEYFGMTVQEITEELAKHFDLSNTQGVIVTQVEDGSSADEAGIRVQDIILQINKSKIGSMEDYLKAMSKAVPEGNVLMLVKRGGSKFFIVVGD
jgi:serine protease Do